MTQYSLEEVPRPVLAFLLGGCKLNPREALNECLRELADEGLVRIEQDASGMPVVSLGADSPRSGRPLLRFEQVALTRVRTRAGRLARVPISALVSDDGDGYKNWAQQQRDELGADAQRAGLAAKSAPRGSWRAVLLLDAVAVAALVFIHAADYKAGDHIAGPVLLAALVALLVPVFLRRWRLTAEGAVAVDEWRRAGRTGTAAGPGPGAGGGGLTMTLKSPGSAPLPRGDAWSSLGGQWHTVRLGQELSRPGWSTLSGLGAVLTCTFIGSFFALTIGGLAFGFDTNGTLLAVAPATLGALVVGCLWLPAYTDRMALPDTTTFTGEIVKLQYVDGGSDSPDQYLVWIDDRTPVSMKFDVAPGLYQRLSVSDLVLVDWSPRRGRLNDIAPASRGGQRVSPPTAVFDTPA